MERRRLRVYVAGPISQGDVFENVTKAIRVGKKMVKDGLAPYVPHFDSYMFAGSDISWNAYLEWDFEWASLAEAVYRLEGPSEGADREVGMAMQQDIPVFYEAHPDWQVDHYGCCGYGGLLEYAEYQQLLGVRR